MKILDNSNQAYMREVIQILSGDKVLSEVNIRREKVGTWLQQKEKTHKKIPPAVANLKKILMSK